MVRAHTLELRQRKRVVLLLGHILQYYWYPWYFMFSWHASTGHSLVAALAV
jgi:hypothetical protein